MQHAYKYFLCFCLIAHAAHAADDVTRVNDDNKAIVTLALENDMFDGKDGNYTNGVRASYLSPESNIPQWIENGADAMPFFPASGHKRWHAEVGQSIFTPSDITIKAPQPDDRPYAGWLYGSVGVLSDTGSQLDNLQLTVGMVGPASLAEQTQKFVHHVIDSPQPQGWDNQLNNELGVVLTYERKWRSLYQFTPYGLGVDISPSIGGSIGNVYTHASIGTVVRLGYDLPADYGPPLNRPNLPGSDFFVPEKDFGWYLFAGLEGRAVARNIFLDGNTFTDSPSVDKYPLIGGIQTGIAFTIHDTRIAYVQNFRSKEYTQQHGHNDFGAITVSWRY